MLEIDPKATQQQIREAYKKSVLPSTSTRIYLANLNPNRGALKHHPDRVPSDSPERPRRTRKFQQINDAYFTLSDPTRRRDYDAARRYQSYNPSANDAGSDYDEEVPRPPPSSSSGGGGFSFPWSAFGFGGGNKNAAPSGEKTEEDHFSSAQFGSVFEEMMREQGMAEGEEAAPTGKFWSLVGGLSGGAMGFIVANFPGAMAGAVAGNRLGAVRDARGKSVYSVFQVSSCLWGWSSRGG